MSHEVALMGDMLNIVAEDMQKHGLSKVEKLKLRVGTLSHSVPDALEMAFEIHKAMRAPILTEDSALEIEVEEARAQCVICGHEYVPDHRVALCPNCGVPGGKLIAGDAIRIVSYEGV